MAEQALGKSLSRIDASIAVLAAHLRNQMKTRPRFRLRPNRGVQSKEPLPVRLFGGPTANLLQVGRTKGQSVRAPSEQEYIFKQAQAQQPSVHFLDAKEDDAFVLAADFSPKLLL